MYTWYYFLNKYNNLITKDEKYSIYSTLCGFTLTKEETGKVAKSEEAFAPGWYDTTCSATSPWNRQDKCANVWFCSINILQRIDDSDVITLSLSRAVLRFCSRAVCSNSWALALTGLRTDIEQVTSILNSIRRTHTHILKGDESLEPETHLLSSRWRPQP